MKAVKSVAVGRHETITNSPIPSVKGHSGFVLVKIKYAGINHCDYLFTDLDFAFLENATLGSEYSGKIVEVAESGCARFKVGDRIAGCVFISLTEVFPNSGCFAEYALVKGDAQFSVNALGDGVSDEQAAGIGVAFSTAYHGLYYCMKLPWPDSGSPDVQRTILVYGGATNTGMIAIQLAKLSGLVVITTCSPKNFNLLRSLGADHVIDYFDKDTCIKQILATARNGLELVFNCYGANDSARICGEVIGNGGIYASVAPWDLPQKEKNAIFHSVQGQMVLGEPFILMGQVIPADLGIFEDWKVFVRLCESLINSGKIELTAVRDIGALKAVPVRSAIMATVSSAWKLVSPFLLPPGRLRAKENLTISGTSHKHFSTCARASLWSSSCLLALPRAATNSKNQIESQLGSNPWTATSFAPPVFMLKPLKIEWLNYKLIWRPTG
ncbi:putative Enoyl reductase (ER) domain-containing protein [Seiridium cardinale]|uniref:Enoyl reductase (ER) domain-containing protein n=1 Tax=Seiridium cardinale TaxID=138064 RepID=A0ABR2XPX0_9PEZI